MPRLQRVDCILQRLGRLLVDGWDTEGAWRSSSLQGVGFSFARSG